MSAPALRDRLRATWLDLLEFALPTSCAACGDFLDGAAGPTCARCAASLEAAAAAPSCARCASPLPDPLGPCGRCRGKGIRPFEAIARLGTFEGTLRGLILATKYGRRWPLVPVLAAELLAQPRVASLLDAADVLVPVPMHWTRRVARGFDQAALLAHALRRGRDRLRVVPAVRRARRTSSQTRHHSRAARRRNLLGAFAATRTCELLRGRRVVIVDDVMTSGATLQAVARALRAGGAAPATLSALVLASANPLKSDLTAI